MLNLFDEILVEREGFAFYVGVIYKIAFAILYSYRT
jgi:hypothetical protein